MRIAVRTELVREHLLERLLAEVERLRPGPAVEAVERSPSPEIARHGYLTRIAETELFEAARSPMPWLAELLADRVPEDVSLDLAEDEPPGRPEPEDGRAASWRVPGPGGHVRHYLALVAARRAGAEPSPQAKRAWLYGFFLRCCEETALPGPADPR